LVVVDRLEIPQSEEDGLESFDEDPRLKVVSPPILKTAAYLEMFRQGEEKLRSLFVVQELTYELNRAFKVLWKEGKIRDVKDVDVKNLLEMDRVVIEQEALDSILRMHQRDLKSRLDINAAHGQARRDAAMLNEALEKTRLLQESKLVTPA
jgi:ribosomal protein L4